MIDRAEDVHPIYVIGDSHALAYRNIVLREQWTGSWFTTRARYISGLTTCGFYNVEKNAFLPPVIETLEYEGLVRKGKATHLSLEEEDFNIATAAGRAMTPPFILLICGDIDIRLILLPMLKDEYDFVPPFDTPYPQSDRPLLSWDICRDALNERIAPFLEGLRRMQHAGFNRIYVQLVTPPTLDDENFAMRHGYRCPVAVRYRAAAAFNRLLSEACGTLNVPSLDIWPLVTENGYLKAEYELDGVHLIPSAAVAHLNLLLTHAVDAQPSVVNHARYELFYRMATGAVPIFDDNGPFNAAEIGRYSLMPSANSPPRSCTQRANGHVPESKHGWVTPAIAKFQQEGMAVIKIDPTAALRWKENLRFDLEVGNDHLDWDWAGNGPSPYSTVIHTATPSPNLLAELKEIFSQAEYEEFFRAIVGAAVTVVSCRPFRSTPHESAGTGPQSWHEDGCPAGVIRGVLYLTDVSENNGPFQYKRSDGSEQTVLGNVGDLLVFDAMRLNHRAMPPKENVRVALDFVFIPRLSHQKLDVAWAGLNHWPADPFFFSIPTSKSAIRQSSRQPQTPIRTHNGHAPSGVGGSAGELMRESDAIRAELAAIRASTSWRVTAPLRRLVDIIRK